MTDFFDSLNQDELDRLDRFLLDRINDDAYTEGMDEGVLDVSELDGFFTALVSGPVIIPPSYWLPVVWGDFEPTWDNAKDFEDVLALMMRHMNGIVAVLMEQPEDFAPMFLVNEVGGEIHTIVDDWCEGYLRGVAMAAEAWNAGGLPMTILLAPIRAFSSETDWQAHDLATEIEIDCVREAITPNVREIHAWWLARRDAYAPTILEPARRTEPRVGRNDPCPCGSGRKYKKCCLH